VLALILAHGLLAQGAQAATRSAAFNTAFWWAIGFTVIALVPAFLLPGTARTRNSVAGPSKPAPEVKG
jgi:hypothetical protein